MAGKPKQSGIKTSLDPHQGFTDIRAKLLHGHREWKMIRLRQLITECRHLTEQVQKLSKDGWSAADERLVENYVEARLAEINTLWRDLSEQFERAVLNGDAEWFERQAKAIISGDRRSDTQKARGRFEAAVAKELEFAFFGTRPEHQKRNSARREVSASDTGRHAEQSKGKAATQQARKQSAAVKRWLADQQKPKTLDIEDATLEPAGKRAGITARQVLDRLTVKIETQPSEIQGMGDGVLKQSGRPAIFVEGRKFESKRRACDAITKLAAQLYGWDLPV
ncbi:MAG: hypothetical protein M3R15_08025 [Acidobacteriota bacterium]|nr:hypothetical protein [Acidobacteriota bacterium]